MLFVVNSVKLHLTAFLFFFFFFFSLDDLLKAGCLHADSIVVVGYRSHGQIYDEDHMADANTIVDVQSIYRCVVRLLFPLSNKCFSQG